MNYSIFCPFCDKIVNIALQQSDKNEYYFYNCHSVNSHTLFISIMIDRRTYIELAANNSIIGIINSEGNLNTQIFESFAYNKRITKKEINKSKVNIEINKEIKNIFKYYKLKTFI